MAMVLFSVSFSDPEGLALLPCGILAPFVVLEPNISGLQMHWNLNDAEETGDTSKERRTCSRGRLVVYVSFQSPRASSASSPDYLELVVDLCCCNECGKRRNLAPTTPESTMIDHEEAYSLSDVDREKQKRSYQVLSVIK